MLVQPLLEDRLEHLADHVLERVDLRRRGYARGDGRELLECLAAVTDGIFVEQRRSEVDRRRQRFVQFEDVDLALLRGIVFGQGLVLGLGRPFGGAQFLLLRDHLLDRREDVFHRGFAVARLHSGAL